MGIDWDEMLADSFVQIEDGKPKKLTLKNWRPQKKFKDEKTDEIRPGLVFDVYKEDNATFDDATKKEYTLTAKGALKLFRPIIEKAEAQGKDSITVSIVAVGKGKERKYSITEA